MEGISFSYAVFCSFFYERILSSKEKDLVREEIFSLEKSKQPEDERIKVQECLKESESFKSIGRELNRDPTTVSKEVKNHILFKRVGSYGKAFNNCLHRCLCYWKSRSTYFSL
ncbi:MAG: hypothetical protein COA82_10855 [Alkaliphilus sp.]|nr:helix-turn-helix domain-containing protein [Alkaliphilus sp. AH-315-G20]PHS30942.1 MAG: hypothetical protein COA82_10855 [Alkaliphilus sp.]